MTRLAAVLLGAALLAGCTVVGGTMGAMSATSANQQAREKQQPETASVAGRVLLGALLGLTIDALIINESMGDASVPDLGGLHR